MDNTGNITPLSSDHGGNVLTQRKTDSGADYTIAVTFYKDLPSLGEGKPNRNSKPDDHIRRTLPTKSRSQPIQTFCLKPSS
jgi:hypothetical protein